jgi:hypothetical protein
VSSGCRILPPCRRHRHWSTPSLSPEHHHHWSPTHSCSKLDVVLGASPRDALPPPSPCCTASTCHPVPSPLSPRQPRATAAHRLAVRPCCPRCASPWCLQPTPGATPSTTAIVDSTSRCPSLPSTLLPTGAHHRPQTRYLTEPLLHPRRLPELPLPPRELVKCSPHCPIRWRAVPSCFVILLHGIII